MQHSKYGASSAHRWLNCPGSIKLSEEIPVSNTSVYAKEGTAAHKLAEICLTTDRFVQDPELYLGTIVDNSDVTVNLEMVDAVEIYLNYVLKKSSRISTTRFVETRFDLSHIHKGMFGTNDCCIYDSLLETLEVIDFKYGAGISVSPEENEQLKFYGLGAALTHKLPNDAKVVLTIVQPRALGDAIKSWQTTAGYLYDFATELQEGVDKTRQKNAVLKTGDWCKFCPAHAVCPKVQEVALETAQATFTQEGLQLSNPEEVCEKKILDISKVLEIAPLVASWFKAIESYAYNLALTGKSIEGYKLVKKRANRVWKYETDELERIFANSNGGKIDKLNWFTEPKIKSPAQMEKIFDKDFIQNLCETPEAGYTLVPSSDKRLEVKLNTLEFEPVIDSDYKE